MSFSRRQFIGTTAVGIAAIPAATSVLGESGSSKAKSDVYIGKGTASEIIPRLIEKMGGIEQFVKKGSRVLIKPNMSFANTPDLATTTSPEAVSTVVKMCLDAGARRIVVCDNTLRDPEMCKQKSGIAEALSEFKGVVLFVPKQDSMFETRSDSKARVLTTVDVVKEVAQTNCLISLPTAKSHSASGVSLNVKGLMGLVKDRGAFHRGKDLHQSIAEQLYYIRPNLCIVDATRALLDNGPAGPGRVQQLDTFVAGTDPVAVDSVAVSLASWYGKTFEGKQVQHLKIAADLGFGNVESDMINQITV